MSREEIIRKMQEAGLKAPARGDFIFIHWDQIAMLLDHERAAERNSWPAEMEAMERQVNILTDALAQAKAEEREECAKVCDSHAQAEGVPGAPTWSEACAAAIRARGMNEQT